ncbi:MAG: hypothetical protein WCD42_07960 [Rhizomicrobium sp.]
MVSRKCLIIPVHRPKAPWLIALLNSIVANQDAAPLPFDIVLATTNYSEYNYFANVINSLQIAGKIRVVNPIGIISIDEYIKENLSFMHLLYNFRCNIDNAIINIKKFVSLYWAMKSGYDWAACIDCDAMAISPLGDLFDILLRNYETGQYFASHNNQRTAIDNIYASSRKMFAHTDQEKVEQLTCHGILFPWFFDMPIYNLADLGEFFDYMSVPHGSLENWFVNLKWGTFDHIVYTYWRCLHKGAALIDYYDTLQIPHITEELSTTELVRISDKYGYAPVWMSAWEFSLGTAPLTELPNLCFVYHCDRFH